MPLFHGNALMANWAPALALGATVALRRRFSASGFLPDVRRFGATYFNYVGRALAYVLATPEAARRRRQPAAAGLRHRGAGRRPGALRRPLRLPARRELRVERGRHQPSGAGRTCRPAPSACRPEGTDVAVVDPDDRRRSAHGPASTTAAGWSTPTRPSASSCAGTRAARFEGYYRNPEADAERPRDGWYWSGDLGYRDEDGWFYFAGRGGRPAARRQRELRRRPDRAHPRPPARRWWWPPSTRCPTRAPATR